MKFPRQSGILCHPTCFPSPFGIGDLGKEAFEFIDFLYDSDQKLWQILPLNPTGYGDSPYQSFSAFAGNPLLISPEKLKDDGLVTHDQLNNHQGFSQNRVEYGNVTDWKIHLFHQAFLTFIHDASAQERSKFERYCKDHNDWLDDYALFMALRKSNHHACWDQWEADIAQHQPESVKRWQETLWDSITFEKWMQFQFYIQWKKLKTYAHSKFVQIIGDLPIFVSYDSADVWAHSEQFNFSMVAGVPPDYFSADGQLWGNPQYKWERMKENQYQWWTQRMVNLIDQVDIIRIDHFRGFEATWQVPFGDANARNGIWVKTPGKDFFEVLYANLGFEIPIIAENLGVITKEVETLRKYFQLPGMKILQFAFYDKNPDHIFLPHNYERNCVAYTGTHDNDTLMGWFHSLNDDIKNHTMDYLNTNEDRFLWDCFRRLFASPANTVILPMQDLLGLDSHARMNFPGTDHGNWQWRFTKDQLHSDIKHKLNHITHMYGR